LSQEDFMKIDLCITVDETDKVLGYGSKYECHQFLPHQPRGKLHRAFSVFLFNSEGKLLLQQRALSKITFPGVWTNTCCSHQLIRLKKKSGSDNETEIDLKESELDNEEAISSATVFGAKRAAIRKLWHELGIPPEQIPIEKFKFLTRLHYWAGDWDNHGPDTEWGEHEMDFILFIQTDVTLAPNPDEAADVKYVTLEELKQMMDPSSGLQWSPWFRIIVDRFLCFWWKDLQLTLTTDTYVDTKTIHHFDPLIIPDVVRAKLSAVLLPQNSNESSKLPNTSVATKNSQDTSRKQGAYGKIVTHKDSKLQQLCHIYEIVPMLYLKIRGFGKPLKEGTDEERFCDDMMTRVSRSFAAVTQHLPVQLGMPITIFYLVLRGLDTVEDDMEAFSDSKIKIDLLKKFYINALTNKNFSMTGVGKGDEEKLLNEFSKVVTVFQSLDPQVQNVISDITRQMGEGMALYVDKDLGQGTVDVSEYNKYCYYVAGIIGNGLSRLFVATGLEKPIIEKDHAWYAMGLFLQKTNIIRDYLEDYVEGRTFWPQEIWKKYTSSGDLGEFAKAQDKTRALHCLNHLITDALEHVPECLVYLSRLHNPEVFLFCAIPQIMAIATLEKCYNNPQVFSGVVKIRKGTSCHIITTCSDLYQVKQWFYYFTSSIVSRIPQNDPNKERTLAACDAIISLTASQMGFWTAIGRFSKPGYGLFMNLLLTIFFAGLSGVVPTTAQPFLGIFNFETIISLLLVASTISVLNHVSTSQKSCNK